MALPIVHLLAAMRWARDLPEYRDCPEYYLGAIAPDAIHIRYGGDKSRKNEFHLMNWTSSHPEEVYAYWRKRFSPFDVGYGIHVMTDADWVPRYRRCFPAMFNEAGMLRTDIYYNDTMRTDFELLSRHPELKNVFALLERASAPEDHPFLTQGEFLAWRDMVLAGYRKECPFHEPVQFVDAAYVEGFIEEVQEVLDRLTGRFFFMKNQVLQAIADRRSIRGYAETQLTEEQLQALLDAALQAPTAANRQPWHFSAVQDKALLDAFDKALREIQLENAQGDARARYEDSSYSVFYHAPTVIFISLQDPAPNPFTPVDAGIAVENIALAAQSMGLGSVILGMPRIVFNSPRGEEFRKAFRFPEGYDFSIAIAVGVPTAGKDAHPVLPGRVDIIK